MRKFLAILTVLTLVLSFAACQAAQPAPATADKPAASADTPAPSADAPAAGGNKVMCFVMPNATHGFLAAAIQNATNQLAAGKDANPGIETRLLTSADASEQNNQLDTLINEKVDTIVLWPHNGDDLRSGALKVIESGIKLVVFDRLISDITPVSEVDMDNFQYGAACATFLNEYFKDRIDAGEKIQILEFKGDNSTASSVRTDGFNATKNASIEVVQAFSTDWQRAKSMDYMETFLIDSPQEYVESIDAIFTHDGEITQGVYDAMTNYKGASSLGGIKAFAGMGSDPILLETFKPMMDAGIYHNMVYVSPGVTAYGVAVGYDVANGKEVPKAVKIGYTLVNFDNYGDFTSNPSVLDNVEVKY